MKKEITESMHEWSAMEDKLQKISLKSKELLRELDTDAITGEELELLRHVSRQLNATVWFSNYVRRSILENQDNIVI